MSDSLSKGTASPTEESLIWALSHGRYSPPKWAVIRHVHPFLGNGTNIDAVAIGTQHATQLVLHGFEVKVSRADWLRERSQPRKNRDIRRYCDFMWYVVWGQKESIIKLSEVPYGCGLLRIMGKVIRTDKAALRTCAIPLDRDFIAELLRRIGEQICSDGALQTAWKNGWMTGYRQGKRAGFRVSQWFKDYGEEKPDERILGTHLNHVPPVPEAP